MRSFSGVEAASEATLFAGYEDAAPAAMPTAPNSSEDENFRLSIMGVSVC
jgi:hypothetical protein